MPIQFSRNPSNILVATQVGTPLRHPTRICRTRDLAPYELPGEAGRFGDPAAANDYIGVGNINLADMADYVDVSGQKPDDGVPWPPPAKFEDMPQVFPRGGVGRWGFEHGDMDFWTACRVGDKSASPGERRAVQLLFDVCDKYRASLYCLTGLMAARGNKTGTVYIIRRSGGVDVLRDGDVCGNYCIGVNGVDVFNRGGGIPMTDNIIVLKNLIEGEEDEFQRIGNYKATSVCVFDYWANILPNVIFPFDVKFEHEPDYRKEICKGVEL